VPAKIYRIKLTTSERRDLEAIRDRGKGNALKIRRAIALLLSDEGPEGPATNDTHILPATGMSRSTLFRLRERCCEVGPLGALERKQREKPPREIKITGEVEARITTLACSVPPSGHARWTLQLLADHVVEIGVIDSISHTSVGTVLKKSPLKPWRQECWCIPPKEDASFVAAMEDVLEVYQRPPNPEIPLVCLDEFAKQLLSETRAPIPAAPGCLARHDYEYVREGSVTGFMIAMPHKGKRDVFVGQDGRRTAKDFAACLDHIATKLLPKAKKILLVVDNLNTHKTASLYEAFEPEKARNLSERFEIHYTPKHGSWLNMAEIEIGLLARTCLDRRISSALKFRTEVTAYLEWKNATPKPIAWQFTNEKARVKLKSLYPSI
jgi:hypothetical protein